MTDIVERLRLCYLGCTYRRAMEAADEIERLTGELAMMREQRDMAQSSFERLRAALRDVIRDVDGYNALLTEKDRDGLTWVSVKRAREALGDE